MNPLAYKLHAEIQKKLKQPCFLFPIVKHYRFQLNDLRYIDVPHSMKEADFNKYLAMFDIPKDTPPAEKKKKRGRPAKKKVSDD